MRLLFSLLAALAAVACGSGTTTDIRPSAPDSDAGGLEGTLDAGAAGEGGDAGPSTPKKVCEAYLRCMADVAPSTAGGLVSLYGDASNCWKGGAEDAQTCGKACQKGLDEQPACTHPPEIDGHYAAVCTFSTSAELLHYDVQMTFDAQSGGSITFRPLPAAATTYRSSDALLTQPSITLTLAGGVRGGHNATPFTVPSGAFPGVPGPVAFTDFSVSDLSNASGQLCSRIGATVTQPIATTLGGACVYVVLAEGAPFPSTPPAQITTCAGGGG